MTTPAVPEQRTVRVDVDQVAAPGRTLVGHAAVFGAVSADLGGWDERVEPGAFTAVLATAPDVVATLNHSNDRILGRTTAGTLRLAQDDRGLSFECDLPDGPLGADVRESVRRGDLTGASFSFTVDRDRWEGRTRVIERVRELRDVSVATRPAYPAATVELRTRPTPAPPTEGPSVMPPETTPTAPPETPATPPAPPPTPERLPAPPVTGLQVETRTATTETPDLEQRVVDAIRSVNQGEARSLNTTTASPIAPDEQGTFLWDRLRPASVALRSGIRVIPTSRDKVVWPRLVADVDPSWIAEEAQIPAGDPAFGTLEAGPHKLAHRVELSNEVIDDSSPSIVDVLNQHLAVVLALKLDAAIFEGNPATNASSIRGLKFTAGIQTLTAGGANGGALTNYDRLLEAVGLLQAANVPGPYAVAAAPRTLTALALLKRETGSNEALAAPDGTPVRYAAAQLSVAETKGTSSTATSVYVYAPAQVVLVRRADAVIELDRSRLFDRDMSEIRAKLRADLIVPNPQAIVRIDGITP